MSKLTIGFLAHVDSGKTTLSEQVLFKAGVIRTLGRVDHKSAFLDSDAEERERGITVYSKEARFTMGKINYTLIDTPGHQDYEKEMMRSLSILDYAILIISGPDGIQLQTKRIIQLLDEYKIPTFIFINKMDRDDVSEKDAFLRVKDSIRNAVIFGKNSLKNTMDNGNSFSKENDETFLQDLSDADDELAMEYLDTGKISTDSIRYAIRDRKIFPVYFGSALKNIGIDELFDGLERYTVDPGYEMRADRPLKLEVFKIDEDSRKNIQVHAKIIEGKLKVKDLIEGEKVNEIRSYNGNKYEGVLEASSGDLITITGVKQALKDKFDIPDDSKPEYRYIVKENIEDIQLNVGETESEEEKEARLEEYRYGDKESKKQEKNLEAIFLKTYGKSKRDEQILRANQSRNSRPDPKEVVNFPQANWKSETGKGNTYYIVDGYNVIFAWEELKSLAEENLDAAREAFIEIMQNFQAFKGTGLLIVFDGYKVKGSPGSEEIYGDLKVVYTKESETADRYIEEVSFNAGKKLDVTVVTSDQMVQMAAFTDGARRISSREFIAEVISASESIRSIIKKCTLEKTKKHFLNIFVDTEPTK